MCRKVAGSRTVLKVWTILFGTLAAAVLLGGCLLYTPDKPRAELEARYLRQPTDLITVAGISLHVRDDGPKDAPALILLHGFGSSLHTFEPWAQNLKEDYRVVRFDLPGSGLSPPDPTGNYTDARSMTLIIALMDQLGIKTATLAGNSIGVRFALPKSAIRPNLTASYGNPKLLTEATVARYYDLMLAPGGRGALLKRMEQTVLTNPADRLPKIKAPVLLLWGKKDRLIPFSNSADYTALLPNSQLVAFKDLGHVPMEENPQVSLAPLRAFLAE